MQPGVLFGTLPDLIHLIDRCQVRAHLHLMEPRAIDCNRSYSTDGEAQSDL
jgi:hypothetical protein